MKNRYFILAAVLLLNLASVSASVYGTFPYNLEQQSSDLKTELRLGVVNAGDQTLELEFSAPESEVYNISMPDRTRLEPTRIETSPEGEGWKYLGNGKYARIQEFSFGLEISRYRDSNRIDVPIQVTASPAGRAEGSSVNPVSQVTTHNYTVLLNPRLRPLERETQMEKEVRWKDTDEVPEEWQEGSESGSTNESKDYKANETDEDTGEREKSGVDTVTMMLAISILACTAYILRVI